MTKKNKTRSILIMMAICLTTMLLVIISTVGNGVIHLQKSQAAGSYGSNYGLFVAADASQLKEVSRRAEIDAIGIMCTEGIVSGILYDRDEYTIEASYVAFGSQEFYDEHVAENDRQYNIYFTLNDSANVSMNNNIETGYKADCSSLWNRRKNVIVNDLYLQWVLQPSYETIAVCGVLILAIVLFSVVVIYNIFQVGIVNKIQEYGKSRLWERQKSR